MGHYKKIFCDPRMYYYDIKKDITITDDGDLL